MSCSTGKSSKPTSGPIKRLLMLLSTQTQLPVRNCAVPRPDGITSQNSPECRQSSAQRLVCSLSHHCMGTPPPPRNSSAPQAVGLRALQSFPFSVLGCIHISPGARLNGAHCRACPLHVQDCCTTACCCMFLSLGGVLAVQVHAGAAPAPLHAALGDVWERAKGGLAHRGLVHERLHHEHAHRRRIVVLQACFAAIACVPVRPACDPAQITP